MNAIARTLITATIFTGAVGGAALGLAGIASATTTTPTGPGYSYSPDTHAHPAPTATPGWHNHHGPQHVANLFG